MNVIGLIRKISDKFQTSRLKLSSYLLVNVLVDIPRQTGSVVAAIDS